MVGCVARSTGFSTGVAKKELSIANLMVEKAAKLDRDTFYAVNAGRAAYFDYRPPVALAGAALLFLFDVARCCEARRVYLSCRAVRPQAVRLQAGRTSGSVDQWLKVLPRRSRGQTRATRGVNNPPQRATGVSRALACVLNTRGFPQPTDALHCPGHPSCAGA
jgi:hypothetical protein